MIRRVLLLVLAVSACSTPAPAAAPTPTSTSAATQTSTSAPRATFTTAPPTNTTALSLPELQAKADRAALAADALADYGIPKPELDVTEPNALTPFQGLCGQKLGFAATRARYRLFGNDNIVVHSAAFTFQARTGAGVIDALAAMGKQCTTWKDDRGFNHKITINFPIYRSESVDGLFTYCDETEDATNQFRACSVLASRGDTLIELITAEHVSRKQGRQQLQDLLPRATERLRTA